MPTAANNISLADHLTREFYAWEKRGRGWQVWPFPVRPEPAFQPFYSHTFPPPVPVDDGRRANFFVSLADGVASFFGGKRPVQPLPASILLPFHAALRSGEGLSSSNNTFLRRVCSFKCAHKSGRYHGHYHDLTGRLETLKEGTLTLESCKCMGLITVVERH